MSVYVDDAMILWRGKRWCHLYADSLPELEAFARRIGLRPEWLQHPDGKTGLPHYDVTGAMLRRCEMEATSVDQSDGTYRRLRQALGRGEYDLGRTRRARMAESYLERAWRERAELAEAERDRLRKAAWPVVESLRRTGSVSVELRDALAMAAGPEGEPDEAQ